VSKKINPIVEELLDSNEIPEEFETPEDLLEGIANMTSEVAEIKQEVEDVKVSGDPITDIKIFNEVSDLINRAVAVLDTCKEDIERSSLLDAELVSAYAKLISSTREIISDNIAIFRDRQKHIEKIELENLKQEHKKEILRMKDDLDKSVNDNYGETKAFVQEAVIELLNDVEKNKKN
tara:strand:+ start:6886 stop:7419 length:534 start_codon:yes stop_codon:yes gene_type:complete